METRFVGDLVLNSVVNLLPLSLIGAISYVISSNLKKR